MNTAAHPLSAPVDSANAVSGARGLRDSMRTHFVLLRFVAVSVSSAAIDNLIFYLLFRATGSIAMAQAGARAISVAFNYTFVRRAVFASERNHRIALPRYLILVAVNTAISYAGIRMLTAVTPLHVVPAKLLTETALFAANFALQRAFIFTRRATAQSAP